MQHHEPLNFSLEPAADASPVSGGALAFTALRLRRGTVSGGCGSAPRWTSMSVNFVSIVALSALLLAVGCRRRVTVELGDVTKPITLTVSPGDAEARGVSVRIRGSIDGVAVVSGSRLGTNRVQGRIDVSYRDNYSTNFTLYYTPKTVRSGFVTMQYVFH